jgi:hypothetical protein
MTISGRYRNSLLRMLCISFALVLINGCESVEPYKKYGSGLKSGIGYQDFQVNSDTLFVSYIDGYGGNIGDAVKNMNHRAKEACSELGFSSYDLMDKPINATGGGGSSSALTTHTGSVGMIVNAGDMVTAQSYVHCVK